MRHILRTFLLSSSLVVSAWAVDIVGIETVQFNQLIDRLEDIEQNTLDNVFWASATNTAVGDVENAVGVNSLYTSLINTYLKDGSSGEGIVETNQDINATLVHVDEDLHDILEALGELNITQEAILVASDRNVSVSVTVDQNGTINAIEALDLQGVIDAVNNGSVAVVAKNEQIRSEVMTNTAQILSFQGDFGNFATSNLLGQQIIGDGISSLNNKLFTGNYIIPQPLDVVVTGGAVELSGNATVDLDGNSSVDLAAIKTAAEALQAIANDSSETNNTLENLSYVNGLVGSVEARQIEYETAMMPIQVAASETFTLAPDNTGVGMFTVDVWEIGGGLQSYDLFNASIWKANVPSLQSFCNWIQACVGLWVLILYWRFMIERTIGWLSDSTKEVESSAITNYGGSAGGIVNGVVKAKHLALGIVWLPLIASAITLGYEVNLFGGNGSIAAHTDTAIGMVLGAGAPSWALRGWQFFSALVPVDTVTMLAFSTATVWLGVYMIAATGNKLKRVVS